MNTDPECIFCRIVSGAIPSKKIAESEHSIAVLDAFPVTKGHSLIIPKRHSADIFDMSDAELADAARLLRDVARAITKAVDCPGINLLSNIGRQAGQVIFHSHFHAIPRFADDGVRISFGKKITMTDDEVAGLIAAIQKNHVISQ